MPSTNPFSIFYEAQTTATAEIVRAALNGVQRMQQLAMQSMQTGSARDVAPMEQGARFQRELLQAFADMNNEIVRASYSMMERMRDALGTAGQGSMAAAFPIARDADANPMAFYDTAVRQWQTTMQRMMETPSVAMAVAEASEARPGAASERGAGQSKATARKRKTSRKR